MDTEQQQPGDGPDGAPAKRRVDWRRIGSRVARGAAEVVVALAIVFEVGALWSSMTLFPHAACVVLGCGALLVRLQFWPLKRAQLNHPVRSVAVVLCVVGLGLVANEATQHVTRDQSVLQSRHVSTSLPGWVLRTANVVPEGDAGSFAIKWIGLLGMHPRDRTREVLVHLRREYDAMRSDPDFGHVGNVASAQFLPGAQQHFFRYLPRRPKPAEGWPALLFLHGAGGNMALYPYLWRPFAEDHGFIVVCPTWDNGEWAEPEGVEAALAALDATAAECSVDSSRIYLAGHSNGAMGGWAVMGARPDVFRGFIAISGESGPGYSKPSIARVPVLFIHGGRDIMIPPAMARRVHDGLERLGRDVTYVEFPDEDHFIQLRAQPAVAEAVWEWMDALDR